MELRIPIIMDLKLILKDILKVYFRVIISSLMRSLKNFRKPETKYNLGLRLFCTLRPRHNIWCVSHSVICVLQGLRGREK